MDKNEQLFFKIFRSIVIRKTIFGFIKKTGKKYSDIRSTLFICKNKYYGLIKDKLHCDYNNIEIDKAYHFECIKHIEDLETFMLYYKKSGCQYLLPETLLNRLGLSDELPMMVDYCANSGKMEFLQYIKENAPIEKYQKSAFDYSCASGSLECVKFIENNIGRDQWNISNDALDNACRGGHTAIVYYLLKEFENNSSLIESKNAMNIAIENGHLEIIKLLEAERPHIPATGASINLAARKGHFQVIQYLCSKHYSQFSNNTVDQAAIGGHLEMVRFLVNHNFRATKLGLNIASKNNNVEICKYLVEIGTSHDENCIRNAILNGNLELVRYYREHFKSTFACSTATFNHVCFKGDFEMCQYLTKLKVPANFRAYEMAVINGHLNIIKFLNSNRPELKFTESSAKYSVYYNHQDIVLYILQNFPIYKSKLLEFAKGCGNSQMIEFISSQEL